MDRLTKEQRRKLMRAVKSKDSNIELKLRHALWKQGYRYRKNYRRLPGTPDIVLVRYKIAIFADSEFWHGYDWKHRKKDLKSNKKFWISKIERNIKRDKEIDKKLKKMGWKVLRFLGKDIEKNPNGCVDRVDSAIRRRKIT